MREILSVEQPCILCGQPIFVVTVWRDHDSDHERTERTQLDHDETTCRATLELYGEAWPWVGGL
jgi:hypothetical protein